MESCPKCHSPYGKRKRCYSCQPAKQKTGEIRKCQQCGKEFYFKAVKEKRHKAGIYCSRKCHYATMKGKAFTPRMPLGSKRTRQDGYIEVKVAEGNGKKDWQLEHRAVMEQYLGRKLESWEHVHHKGETFPIHSIENRQENRVENFQLITNLEHARLGEHPRKRIQITCHQCGKEFETWPHKSRQVNETYNRKYCSLACKYKSWGRIMTAKRLAKAIPIISG